MAKAQPKKWFLSKGKIGAVLVALGALGGYLTGTMDLATAFTAIAGALSFFGLRDKLDN